MFVTDCFVCVYVRVSVCEYVSTVVCVCNGVCALVCVHVYVCFGMSVC